MQAAPPQKAAMTEARGTFTVHMQPRPTLPADGIAAMSLDKVYSGDLQATAAGEFLSAGDPKTGNAGYVAMERVTGTIGARTGSFALMQSGIMATGAPPSMTVTVVPGSGTGEFSGIYGSMTILIDHGAHSYILSYAFSK